MRVSPLGTRRGSAQQGSPLPQRSPQAGQQQASVRSALMAVAAVKAIRADPEARGLQPQPQARRVAASQAQPASVGSYTCIALAWFAGAALLALAAVAFLVASRSGAGQEHHLRASKQPVPEHLQEEFLQKAYRVTEDFYRSQAKNSQQEDAEQLQQRAKELRELRLQAVQEDVRLNDSTPWGEPIISILDRIIKGQSQRSSASSNSSTGLRNLMPGGQGGLLEPGAAGSKAVGNATASTVPAEAAVEELETLFCFSLMMSTGREPELIAMQVSRRVSIFACDAYAVYSRDPQRIGPGPPPYEVETTPVYMSLRVDANMESHPLNAEAFMRVWEAVFQKQTFWNYKWTVKVDPDCVLLPAALRAHLQTTWFTASRSQKVKDRGFYLRNCAPKAGSDLGLTGALEVLSRQAVEAYAQGKLACAAHIDHERETEDHFLQRCLDFLRVPHQYDFGLVDDRQCIGHPRPCNGGHAAFHPMKDTTEYVRCIHEAGMAHKDQGKVEDGDWQEVRALLS